MDAPLGKLYTKRNHRQLEPYFSRHMDAMTGEGLHEKGEIAAELAWRDSEIDRLRLCESRYETVRRMSIRQWIDAWELNISTGKPFDEIIDDLRPFMFT